MTTDLQQYLTSKGYAMHVIRDGVPGLVASWERVADGLSRGNSAYVMYYEFLNDVDGRRILQECIEVSKSHDLAAWSERISRADEQFRLQTIPVRGCVWGEKNAANCGWTSTRDWYYYRRPKVMDDTWPREFSDGSLDIPA